MMNYKAIATITWKFESEKSPAECLEYAKHKLEEILDCRPHGHDFDGFSVQVDLAKMKAKKRLLHITQFDPAEIFDHITLEETKKDFQVDDVTYSVRMNSHRYHVFKANPKCVCCGVEGTRMVLDINPGDQSPHFNLYAEENGRLVLMTKDHIVPKSRGGKDVLENYQTMCAVCNNLKGAYDLTLENIKELKCLWDNPSKLPRKELRDLINNTRDMMTAQFKSGGKDSDGYESGSSKPHQCNEGDREKGCVLRPESGVQSPEGDSSPD